MKKQYLFLSLIAYFLWISPPSVSGQKPCNNFDCAYKKAENFLKQAAYQKALDNLDSAEGYLTDTNTKEKEQIKQLRRRLFVAIEKEKENAKRASDEAKRQTKIAKKAEERARAVLDKIYFYDDKFGLAYDKEKAKYGFIDKDLKTKIRFKYDEALPFDYTGFAKVKTNKFYSNGFKLVSYLIDTLGQEYKLSSDINQLDASITALDLSNKELKEIPPSVFQHEQLKILLLGTNKLNSLPTEFGKLTHLTSLDLSSNQLSSLPTEFGNLTHLIDLYLDGNKLSSLPTEFGNLTHLIDLYLSRNQLNSLPIEFGNLTHLTSLNLRGNQLSSLPTEFGNLTHLTSLDLSSNQLSSLPTEFGNLTHLIDLDLGYNQLSSLPTEFGKLTNLTWLGLRENPISKEGLEKIKKLLPNCDIAF